MSKSNIEKMQQIDGLHQRYNTVYQKVSATFGLSYSAMLILYTLSMGEARTQKELSEALFLPKQTVHSAVNSLIKSGYITSQPSRKNMRIKELMLTASGETFADMTVRPLFSAEQMAASQMTDEEMDTLFALTHKHIFLLEEAINQKFNL